MEQADDFSMRYHYSTATSGEVILAQQEIFHLRDLSLDGVTSLSRTKLANQAILLANYAEKAAIRIFEKGNMAAGFIEFPTNVSLALGA